MKTINLTNAFEVLTEATAVVLEGRVLAPHLFDLEYNPDNEFFRLAWEEDGLEFEISFEEGDNNEVVVNGHTMKLISNEGVEEEFELLKEFNIEESV